MTRNNLAGRAGAWAAANPKTALFGWLAFTAIAVTLGAAVGEKTLPESGSATRESARAERMLAQSGLQMPAEEAVFIQFKTIASDSQVLYATIGDVVNRLKRQPDVYDVTSPLERANQSLVTWDIRSAIVPFRIRGNSDDAPKKVEPILDAVASAQRAHPTLLISQFGNATSQHALDKSIVKDFRRAELTTVPLTLAILLVAFGALVAAGLPVLLAFSGVLAALGLASVASHAFPASSDMKSVILLVGMAVGIDYSLFYIRREREERANGLSRSEALLKTARTSGLAVLVSGVTVLIAMAGMFFSGSRIFTSFAVGTMLMVAVALVGSLTVLPALLSLLGDRVDRGRVRFLGRGLSNAREPRLWPFVIDRVLRRPALSAALSAAALVALAVPALGLHTQLPNVADLPASAGLAETHDRIQTWYGGVENPAVVVIQGDMTAPRVRDGVRGLQQAALSRGQMETLGTQSQPVDLRYNANRTAAVVAIPLKGKGNDATSKKALARLRNDFIPSTIGRVPGVSIAVTGPTAATADFNATMLHRMPVVFAFVLLLVFVLLLATFRSIVVPIKAVLLNLLSVGAAYGVLVAVFQHRWAEGILGFHSNGAVVSWLPMFMFVILFGLSMDYHVFILSRVKELVDDGMETEQAVAVGIKRTAGVVTSAAVVMIAVFGIFATLNVLEMKQMGVGLAAAILIDATLVRAVLLPATMKLLGEWNWYLPRWLEWLPRLHAEREAPVRMPEAPAFEPA
jgi:uncharacterized membrane protein YdfJ with MMPL/SSD domain